MSVAKMVTAMGMATAVMLLVIPLPSKRRETPISHDVTSIKKVTIIGSLPGRERPPILFHKLLERLHERQVRFEHSKIQSQW